MTPKIYAKSALKTNQAEAKLAIGYDALEIQLLNEIVIDRPKSVYRHYEEVFDIEQFARKYTVNIIHAPLLPGSGDTLLEAVIDKNDLPLLKQVFDMAQTFANIQGHDIGVVIHSESYYYKLMDEDVWPELVEQISKLLGEYSGVYLLIENVSPLRDIGKSGKQMHFANNATFDNVEMVKNLREAIGTNRIYTCLDICHAMLADKYISILYDAVGDVQKLNLSMEQYFIENKDVIGLIHLSDIKGSGYGRGRHGIPFYEETYDKLCSILDLYVKHNYTCPITLEVEEEDYNICTGYATTKKLVNRYFENLNK